MQDLQIIRRSLLLLGFVFFPNIATADWRVVGSYLVQDCVGLGITFCSGERPDAVIRGGAVYELPSRLSSVDSGPRRVGEEGKCEATIGYTQRFAVYKGGDRGDPSSYATLRGRTAFFRCRRID